MKTQKPLKSLVDECFFMSFSSFLAEYGVTIAFYVVIILLIVINRKKFHFESKIIAMYRTKIGIKMMHKWGSKARKLVRFLGVFGIVIGFAGMLTSVFFIGQGFYNLIAVPDAPPTFSPVIPGANIPGLNIKVPLFAGLLALFISVVVHEFAHGVVGSAYSLRIKSSGFVMFGPLPGAFVEPDEKQLRKASTKAQLSVYAAGPFSNILLTIIAIILFGFLPIFAGAAGVQSDRLDTFTRYTSIVNFAELSEGMYELSGIRIVDVVDDSAAAVAGLPQGTLVTSINDASINDNVSLFFEEYASFDNLTPGDKVVFGNGSASWTIITKANPDNESRGWIGIMQSAETKKSDEALDRFGLAGFFLLEHGFDVVFWLILLSSGLGLANLLPLGPVDGGRMLLAVFERFMKKEKAQKLWLRISSITFVAVLILVFVPMIRGWF